MSHIVVIAPHPDDETLGCGGTLLRHKENGDTIHWLLLTSAHREQGYADAVIQQQENCVRRVVQAYPMDTFHWLKFPSTSLDTLPKRELVQAIDSVFREVLTRIAITAVPLRPRGVARKFSGIPH